MPDNLKEDGYWWLSKDPQARIPGSLSFSYRDGIRLQLLGNFDSDTLKDPRGFNILGETTFGKPITVHQAFFESSQTPGGQPTAGKSSFIANKAFIGAHFSQMEDVVFKQIAFQAPYLDTWLQLDILDYDHKDRGFAITYTLPQLMTFEPVEGITLKIGFTTEGPPIGSTVTDISFTHRAMFILELQEPSHFNVFGELIAHLTNMLSLAVIAPVRPIEVQGWLPRPDESPRTQMAPIDVLLPLHASPKEDDIHFFDMLFSYPSVKDRLPALLKNWFGKREILRPVFDLYFGVLYNPNPYPVTTFLNYIQAIETYHIRTMTDEVDHPDLHRARVREILAASPEQHRGWLADQLAFSNKPTLAQRLREMIALYPFPVSAQAGSHETFIKRVRDTRNYYTHYDPSLEERAQKGGYLKGLSMTLGTLLEGLVIHELGFPFEEIKQMQWTRRRLPAVWF